MNPTCNSLKKLKKKFCQNFLKESGTQNRPASDLLDPLILSTNFGYIIFRIKMATFYLGMATLFLGLATLFLGITFFQNGYILVPHRYRTIAYKL